MFGVAILLRVPRPPDIRNSSRGEVAIEERQMTFEAVFRIEMGRLLQIPRRRAEVNLKASNSFDEATMRH